MKDEVKSAVDFLTNILRNKDEVNESQTTQFNYHLCNLLCNRYEDHWFPEKPFKGSGYRCIRLNHKMDPLMIEAGKFCGLDKDILTSSFPPELTIWVDPNDVSYRIGENGSVGILYGSSSDSDSSQPSSPALQEPPQHHPVYHPRPSRNINDFFSCQDQFMHSFPGLSREAVHYKQLAGFVSS